MLAGEQGTEQAVGIDVLNKTPSPQEFFEQYVAEQRPVLLRGLAEATKAYSKWTDKYLKEKYGNVAIEYEHGKKESRSGGGGQAPMRELLRMIQTDDVYAVSDVPLELRKDLELPSPIKCGGAESQLSNVVMWFSGGGTHSVFHNDMSNNINCLLAGTKKLVLVNASSRAVVESEGCGWRPRGAYSAVDVDAVDLDAYPGFASLQYFQAEMEPGDCLYIPFRWYHQVNSFERRNLAVNYWFSLYPDYDAESCIERGLIGEQRGRDLSAEFFFDDEALFDAFSIDDEEELVTSSLAEYKVLSTLVSGLSNRGAVLSTDEFSSHMQSRGFQTSEPVLRRIFSGFDLDGDGALWVDEVVYGERFFVRPPLDPLNVAESDRLEQWQMAVAQLCRISAATKHVAMQSAEFVSALYGGGSGPTQESHNNRNPEEL
jgi:hypothetical protein